MTIDDFNQKWMAHLEEGHYGLDIYDENVIQYLDLEFSRLEKDFPFFTFSQIKLKFGRSRVYMDPKQINTNRIEQKINEIIDKK